MSDRALIACLGAGRMARGVAVMFAYAGHPVTIVDVKVRDQAGFERTAQEAIGEVEATLGTLSQFGLFPANALNKIIERVSVIRETDAAQTLGGAAVIFECVPEVLDLKRDVLARASAAAGPRPIIASTTSTILVDDLSGAVAQPERFLNAHYLNPAFLVPLVEVSPGAGTDPAVVERLKTLLESIGKVPVVCAARPGFIVPRIQALAMNEAARLVEEGVASAADVDKAIKYGFGFALRCWACWNSSIGAAVTFFTTPAAISPARCRTIAMQPLTSSSATCTRAVSGCERVRAFSITKILTSRPIVASGCKRSSSCSSILGSCGTQCCSVLTKPRPA